MRIRIQFAVFVVAILVVQAAGRAGEPATPDSMPCPAAAPSSDQGQAGFGFNGFRQYRMTPDPGAPGSAGSGFLHFTMPMNSYTTWYRPRAATLTQSVRCAPDPFRPRGFGHLFARPCDGYRMDYKPYVLSGDQSHYGPAYIGRQPDPRCENCDPTVDHHHH